MGFSLKHPAIWHAVAKIEESSFERRYFGVQAGPGQLAHMATRHDEVALGGPADFHPTVGASKFNPEVSLFLVASHLFAGA